MTLAPPEVDGWDLLNSNEKLQKKAGTILKKCIERFLGPKEEPIYPNHPTLKACIEKKPQHDGTYLVSLAGWEIQMIHSDLIDFATINQAQGFHWHTESSKLTFELHDTIKKTTQAKRNAKDYQLYIMAIDVRICYY